MSPAEHQPQERADRWVLPVGDGVVTQLQIDFAFGFTVEQSLHVKLGEPFVVETDSGPVHCDPEGAPESMGRLIDLHQAVVSDASVYKDGSLTIMFRDGRTLRVQPGEHYEAFEVNGAWDREEPFRLISLPGGGLAEYFGADARS